MKKTIILVAIAIAIAIAIVAVLCLLLPAPSKRPVEVLPDYRSYLTELVEEYISDDGKHIDLNFNIPDNQSIDAYIKSFVELNFTDDFFIGHNPTAQQASYDALRQSIYDDFLRQTQQAINSSIAAYRNRLERAGCEDIEIESTPEGSMLIKYESEKDIPFEQLISSQGLLEFYTCHDIGSIASVLLDMDGVITSINTDHSLFSLVDARYATYGIIGAATESDMEILDKYLADPRVKELIPDNLLFMWSVKPELSGNRYILYALRSIDGKPALDGEAVDSSRANYSERGTSAEVHLVMTTDGAAEWARLTKQLAEDSDARNYANGLPLAIVVDKRVYSAPYVREEITGGNSIISGNFTIGEAEVLANVLNSNIVTLPIREIRK